MKKSLLNIFVVLLITCLKVTVSSGQGVYNMCTTTSTTDTSGTLYDSGGPSNSYVVNEDCTLLVAPSCATSITLTFQQFDTESGFDFFHVYDGQTTAAPELLVADGSIVPPPVTCTSGYMLIVWHSDFTVIAAGWACTWTSVIAPSVAPTAAFNLSTTTPPLGINMQFTDQSTGGPTSWLWYFGDGDTARSMNPTHAYSTAGPYTVTLIAFTCNESDTITHNVTVQAAPHISVSPSTGLSANVQCGDSATFNLNVSNTAGGQLVYSTDGSIVGSIKVLAMSYGTDPFSEFPHTISAINQYFTNYTLTTTATTNAGTLSGLLNGVNVLLIPEHESGNDSVWINLGPVIRQYLNNGGSVVFLGSTSSYSSDLFNTGVFTGSYSQDASGFTSDVLIPGDPLAAGLGVTSFNSPSATYTMQITNPDKVKVVDSQGDDVVTYRHYGSGKAIFIAFDYYTSSAETQKIIANAIQWGGQNALPQWIHINPTGGTVSAGNTNNGTVKFIASGFPAGTYYANIGVASNDPLNPIINVPCTLTVSGIPLIALSNNCLSVGQVMQHTSVQDTFRVVNNGCDTLLLGNIHTGTSAFTVNANFSFLLPGAYADVFVTFNGTTVGSFTDTVYVPNNDVDTFVCLTATTFPAPVVTPSVSSLIENLKACSDTGSVTFTISNTGGSPLYFHLGSFPSWATATPTSDTLAANGSVTITLHFNTGTMVGGSYPTNVLITSNDPLAPNKSIPLTLNVDFNPCVSYTVNSNTCTGYSQFTTTSINTPTTYHWNFGDGDTANIANPNHGYSQNGIFTATLIACNASGCDTVTQSITAIITGPTPSCVDTTTAYCCGIGITLFQLSGPFGYLFNKTSADAIDGYKDYTCSDFATLQTNLPYSLNIKTGFTYVETVKMWLDLNNDGVLDANTEQMYLDSATLTNHIGTVTIPALPTNVYGEPLRLRLASDYSGNPTPLPCLNLQFGQVEDYSVFLQFYDDVSELTRETGFNVYPNPFGVSSRIEYTLSKSSKVSLEVFNILGEKINTIATSEMQSAGKHSYSFEGRSSGVYFVKITVDDKTGVKKIMKM